MNDFDPVIWALINTDPLLTCEQTSEYLNVPVRTLQTWRTPGRYEGPAFCKFGSSVRYRKSDLDEWVASHVHQAPLLPRRPLDTGERGRPSTHRLPSGLWQFRCLVGTSAGNEEVSATDRTSQVALDNLDLAARGHVETAQATAQRGSGAFRRDTELSVLFERHLHVLERTGKATTSTLSAYRYKVRKVLAPRFGTLTIDEATTPELDDRMRAYEDETGHDSRQVRSILRGAMKYACTPFGPLVHNPALFITPSPKKRRENPREVRPDLYRELLVAVDAWATGSKTRPRNVDLLRDVVQLQAATGERIGEVLALRPKDVNLTDRTIHICGTVVYVKGGQPCNRRQDWTKSGKNRAVVVPAFVLPLLMRRIQQAPHAEAPLLPTAGGNWQSRQNVSRQWRRVREEQGLPEWLIPHDLRRMVTTTITDNFGLTVASRHIGHAHESTTAGSYAHRPVLDPTSAAVAQHLDDLLAQPQAG